MSPRRIVLFFALLALAPQLHAQIRVDLKISRRLFIAYEPVIATVSITNLTGRDVMLDSVEGQQWFSFQITTGEGSLVPPRQPDYELPPLMIPAGQTLKRKVDLNALYPINDFGLYRVRASILFPEMHRYFSSAQSNIEISEGKVIWQQTVGVPNNMPGAGSNRVISLLTFRQPKDNMLYVRIEDRDADLVYATIPVGRILSNNEPQVQLDLGNQVHILQVAGPKNYLYTQVGLNGEWLGQTTYNETKNRPHLAKLKNGNVEVKGGQVEMPVAQTGAGAGTGPKLSDRPKALPNF